MAALNRRDHLTNGHHNVDLLNLLKQKIWSRVNNRKNLALLSLLQISLDDWLLWKWRSLHLWHREEMTVPLSKKAFSLKGTHTAQNVACTLRWSQSVINLDILISSSLGSDTDYSQTGIKIGLSGIIMKHKAKFNVHICISCGQTLWRGSRLGQNIVSLY